MQEPFLNIDVSGETKRTPSKAPGIGEHSVATLEELGCPDDQIERWLRNRVVIQQ
jgi:hypothetical protein